MIGHLISAPLSCPPNGAVLLDKNHRILMFLDTVYFGERVGEIIGFTSVDPITNTARVIVQFVDGLTLNIYSQLLEQTESPLGEFAGCIPLRFTPYGSRTYNTETALSDYDFIGVCGIDMDTVHKTGIRTVTGKSVDVTVYGATKYVQGIERCDIAILESISVAFPLVPLPVFNTTQLRAAISEKASHSWVKGKKKMTVEADYNMYAAKKSLFHSLRILKFGTAIAQHGVLDLSVFSMVGLPALHDKVMNIEGDWDVHYATLHPLFNKYSTEFKAACPKIDSLYSKSKLAA